MRTKHARACRALRRASRESRCDCPKEAYLHKGVVEPCGDAADSAELQLALAIVAGSVEQELDHAILADGFVVVGVCVVVRLEEADRVDAACRAELQKQVRESGLSDALSEPDAKKFGLESSGMRGEACGLATFQSRLPVPTHKCALSPEGEFWIRGLCGRHAQV